MKIFSFLGGSGGVGPIDLARVNKRPEFDLAADLHGLFPRSTCARIQGAQSMAAPSRFSTSSSGSFRSFPCIGVAYLRQVAWRHGDPSSFRGQPRNLLPVSSSFRRKRRTSIGTCSTTADQCDGTGPRRMRGGTWWLSRRQSSDQASIGGDVICSGFGFRRPHLHSSDTNVGN